MIATTEDPEAGTLESIHLSLTNVCERNCPMCKSHAGPDGPAGHHLSWDVVNNILRQAPEMGVKVIAMGGGEPAEYPWLPPLVEHRAFDTIQPSFTTTMPGGILRSYESVGRDPSSTDFHLSWDEHHSKGSYTRSTMLDDIVLLREKKVNRIGVNHVVTKTDYLRQLAEFENIDQVVLLSLKPENWRLADAQVQYMVRKYKERKTCPSLLVDACSGGSCGQGVWSMHVGFDGTVGACSHQTEGRIIINPRSNLHSVWEAVKQGVRDGNFGFGRKFCPAKEAITSAANVQAL